MADRIKALTVVLQDDVRDDDAEPIISAIRMLKGVVAVEAHVADLNHFSAKAQLRVELRGKLFALLNDL